MNYSTTVPSHRTVAQICEILAVHGAAQILTEFGGIGVVSGIAFAIDSPVGMNRYRLPINVAAVATAMDRDRTIPPRFKSQVQAERVAWRIMKDWLEAQLAIVATGMVSFDQVMLSYMLIPGEGGERTVYDAYLDGRMKELGSG